MRAREFQSPPSSGPRRSLPERRETKVEALTAEELRRLRQWERNMVRFHAVAIPLLILSAAAVFFWSDVVWLRRLLLALVLALVAGATFLQLRERCPRCRARLRTKSFLALPARCNMCGVPFENPPS